MSKTHHRDGDKALLQYTVSKLVNDDGTVTYLLCEVYQTPEGVADHIEQARGDAHWDPFHGFLDKCEVIGSGPARHHRQLALVEAQLSASQFARRKRISADVCPEA